MAATKQPTLQVNCRIASSAVARDSAASYLARMERIGPPATGLDGDQSMDPLVDAEFSTSITHGGPRADDSPPGAETAGFDSPHTHSLASATGLAFRSVGVAAPVPIGMQQQCLIDLSDLDNITYAFVCYESWCYLDVNVMETTRYIHYSCESTDCDESVEEGIRSVEWDNGATDDGPGTLVSHFYDSDNEPCWWPRLSNRQLNALCMGLGGQFDSLVAHSWAHERCHLVLDTLFFRSATVDVPAVAEDMTGGAETNLKNAVRALLVAANNTVRDSVRTRIHPNPSTGPGFHVFLKAAGPASSLWNELLPSVHLRPLCP
jgi:hypothetical protein